jgi:hypothetical protein
MRGGNTVKGLIAIVALVAGLAAAPVDASDGGYIYGRVVTEDGETFQGPLRWGDEEAFWHDMFNATKAENEHLRYVDDEVVDRLRRERHGFLEALFADSDEELGHIFAIRFGDLKRIEVDGRDRLTVEFRNGETQRLSGGSNDVGAKITVVDAETGTREIRWNRIKTIDFAETPQRLAKKLGEPLYGTVKTRRQEFTGYIQWDHDECLSTDELDGEDRDGHVSIAFGEIASIKKHWRGAMVTLTDGSEELLTGSNDVNNENRGVVVQVPDIGRVRIGWDDFEEVKFRRTPPGSGRGYAEYGDGAALQGVVETRGGRHQGRIVFDLDESWDFELLHGRNGDTEYMIPFGEITSITPRGRFRADVKLRSGVEIELEDTQDVSRDNYGVLVFAASREPTYVDWRDVKEIRFGR